jgi:hypothetical protein
VHRARVVRTAVGGLALLAASVSGAQEDAKASCRLPRFRGATAPGGATVEVTVLNNGRPCRFRMLSDVDAQLGTSELQPVEAPQHGKLEFPGPDVAQYTPDPSYVGPDRFAVAGRGPTARGTTASVHLNLRVTVVSP